MLSSLEHGQLWNKGNFARGIGADVIWGVPIFMSLSYLDSTPSKLLASHTSTVGRLAWLAGLAGCLVMHGERIIAENREIEK